MPPARVGPGAGCGDMRFFTIALLSAVAFFRSCDSAPPQPIEQSTTDRFRDSLGVNLHL